MKYKLGDSINIECDGKTHKVRPIIATKDLITESRYHNVKVYKGDVGGYVENISQLSQAGECWIDEDVILLDNARITGDVFIKGSGFIRGNVTLSDNAGVNGEGFDIFGDVKISDYVTISGDNNKISGNLTIKDYCYIFGNNIVIENNGVLEKHVSLMLNGTLKGEINISGCLYFSGFYIKGKGNVSGVGIIVFPVGLNNEDLVINRMYYKPKTFPKPEFKLI